MIAAKSAVLYFAHSMDIPMEHSRGSSVMSETINAPSEPTSQGPDASSFTFRFFSSSAASSTSFAAPFASSQRDL